jgi:transglutaminase-like putative cysteine protease
MNSIYRSVFGVAVVGMLLLSAARSLPATEGWLPIPPEDLALKDNPKQPGADAMILYRESVIDARKANTDGDTVEDYYRIKIFTQEGTKHAHVEIPFGKGWEDVNYVAGRTIRPDGSIVKFDGQVLETTAVRGGGLKIDVKTFTLPDVQPGCIIEYKDSRQAKPGYVHNEEWEVASDMFTREAHFTYRPYEGYGGLGLTPRYRTSLLPAGTVPKQQIDGSFAMTLNDILGIEQEPLMPPERTMEPRVEFYYEDTDTPSEDDPANKYWDHWAKKWTGQLDHFIDKKNALAQELAKIVDPSDPPETKLRKIYARVQQIRNLDVEEARTAQEMKAENLKAASNVEELLSRGAGYDRQINYLFVGLCRAAGFEATEVYIAPRSRALFVPERKDVSELDDDIVWVRANSKEYYLDPAAHFFPFGLLPWYETEAAGLRIDEKHATNVVTPNPDSADATVVRNADLVLNSDGSITGTLQIDFTGQRGALLREEERKDDETGRTKKLEDRIRGWLPVGSTFQVTKLSNWDDVNQPVRVEGTIKVPTYASGALQRMLMPLDPFQAEDLGSFASQKRVNPIYFPFPYEEFDDVKLRAPSGFKAESVPAEKKVDLGAASYSISVSAQGDTVEVKRHMAMKGVLFGKDAYPALRAFYGMIRTNDDAQMVLQNATSAKNN